MRIIYFIVLYMVFSVQTSVNGQASNLMDEVRHGFVQNDSVRIHYATLGEGPLLIMIHGFPDFWYSWRYQMEPLAKDYQVVAIDQRGYNKSDKPRGVAAYSMSNLASDVIAVIDHFESEKAIIAGHDWGGAVAWTVAMMYPQRVDKLMICNLPHPKGMSRELATNPQQQKNSQYARDFQQEGIHKTLTAEGLAEWIAGEDVKSIYIDAFRNSDFEAMTNYYKANYPREPYSENSFPLPNIQCPVLLIHGLDDWALLPGALNDTWEWIDQDLTLVTIPGAGHFVQHDAADLVTRSMIMWLNR